MFADETILAKATVKILDAVAAAGIARDRLLSAVEMDAALLSEPDSRIPYAMIIEMYEEAARLTGDNCFGLHMGEQVRPQMFDVMGYIMMNCPTLGEALDRATHYHAIWNSGATVALISDGARATIRYRYMSGLPDKCRQDCECTLAIAINFGRQITGVDWTPREARFRHSPPADTSEHERLFRCPVRFNCPENELLFDHEILKLPVAQADANLYLLLARHAEEMLSKCVRSGLSGRVRQQLAEAFHCGDASLETISKRLGIGARTLQRKLKEEGTSYQELLDETRRDLSLRYLQDSDMAVCELAYLLGFSEPSAFHRAFRRWTGTTPADFRKKN